MKKLKILLSACFLSSCIFMTLPAAAQDKTYRPDTVVTEITNRNFTTFDVKENVRLYRASFSNQYGLEIVGYLFVPATMHEKAQALVIGHPMGAVKEQASCVYASELASRGFVCLAVDQQFWGESGGNPRHGIDPDMYAETFNAAVDFLGTRDFIDKEKIGAIGICGSGSFVISAAKIDPRIKAIATISMYNIGEMRRSGINHSQDLQTRKKIIEAAANQRYSDFLGGEQKLIGGSPFKVNENSPLSAKSSYSFYRGRGAFIPKGEKLEENTKSDMSTNIKFMNFYPFNDIETISPRPMLFIIGENAHSKYFSKEAYEKAGEPKELFMVKGADHFDLYDQKEFIPFDKLEKFFKQNL